MPGIFGIANHDTKRALATPFAEMAERLRQHAWYQDHRHLDEAAGIALGRVSLGITNAAEQPAWNEDRSLAAVLEGEVYDYNAQRSRLAQAGHTLHGPSHAELLVHGYEAEGKAFLEKLHGKFVGAIWDSRARQLILVNDRFGMKPLYYVKLPGRFLLASEIKALLADPDVPRRSDLRGIAQFFTFGQLLGEDTMLEAVRLLPAAGWLTYDLANDRVTVERYWRLSATRPDAGLSPGDALERFRTAFEAAIERSVAGTPHLGLSLSGGMDARTILGTIGPETPITTVSIGMEGSRDHRSAAEMARLTGRPHRQCLLGEGFLERFEEHLEAMVHLTDGHYLSQCIVMPTLPVYRELGIQVLLRGHAGELMHMGKAYNFSLDRPTLASLGSADEAALEDWLHRHLQTYMLEGTEGRLFVPAHREAMSGLARESLRACLAESAGIEPLPHRIWHLFLTQRLRRETAMSMVKFGSLVETRLPYLDNELVDAVFRTPPDMKLDETIQAHILRRRCPAFLGVINVNTGARVDAGPLGRFVGKVRQKVLAKLGARGYQPYERMGLWLRRELSPLVQRLLLSDRCLERGIFEPQTVRDVVANHLAGRRNHTFLILALLVFEVGQRQLIDRCDGPDAGSPGTRDRSLIPA